MIPGHDIGIVIIVVTLVIRIVLAPFTHKSLKGQRKMTALQPKLNELREKHKGDKQEQVVDVRGRERRRPCYGGYRNRFHLWRALLTRYASTDIACRNGIGSGHIGSRCRTG